MIGYRVLFGIREFRYLYAGLVCSSIGDQLASVAIAVLVFDRTDSGLLTGLAYASGYLPAIVAGPALSAYADRLPRRSLLIACDLVRAVLVMTLAIPGQPVWVSIAVLYAMHLFTTPFLAARSALLSQILVGELYITGNGLNNITYQLCQVGGFALGGIVVALIGPVGALIVNAGTFFLSAALTAYGIRSRPAAKPPGRSASVMADMREGLRHVFGDPWLRGCLLLVWPVSMFAHASEAIAYPFAKSLGGGAPTAGLMLASAAAGFVLGALLLTRALPPRRRDRLILPFAILSGAALIPTVFAPSLSTVLALLFVSGLGGAFSAALNALFVQRVGIEYRGRAMGVALAGLGGGHGAGYLASGAITGMGVHPATTTAIFGTAATVAAIFAGLAWTPSTGRHRKPHPHDSDLGAQ